MEINKPVISAIIIFAVILLAYFFVMPKYNNLQDLKNALAIKKSEYLAKFDYYSEVKNKYDQIQKRKDDIKKIDDALPKSSNFGQLIYFMQKKVLDSGLALKNLALSQSAPVGGIKDITFTMSISGSYDSLQSFIILLEKSDRIFEVSNISFGAGSSAAAVPSQSQPAGSPLTQFGSSGIFNFNIQVKTYTY